MLIACLALGAGVAVPRQDRLVDENERAATVALARNAKNALELTRLRWEQSGRPLTLPGSRGAVALVNGYPSVATLPLLLSAAETDGFTYADGRWVSREKPDPACSVNYNVPPDGKTLPALKVVTTGC